MKEVDWKSLVYLDETSPSGLRWKQARLMGNGDERTIIGGVAGGFCETHRYWKIGHQGKRYNCHRVAWYLQHGEDLGEFVVDHLNGDRSDNSFSNLKPKSVADNSRNRKMQADNTSGVTGVYLNKKRYKGEEALYWMASWIDENGVQRAKCFRVSALGYEQAKDAAISHRNTQIERLRLLGFNYTERHGKEK